MNWPQSDDDILAAPNYYAAEEPDAVDEFLVAPNYSAPESGPTDMDDPLSVPHYRGDEEAEITENQSWRRELGFPDGTRAIRVWANDEGVLSKVRVSLNWREKLKNSSLDAAFFTVFLAMNAMLQTGAHKLPEPEPLPAEPYDSSDGWEALLRASREQEELHRKVEKLGDVSPTRWVGNTSVGDAFDGKVKVTLGIFGQPISAHFDSELVAGPLSSSDISRGVMAAYFRARAKHTPPTVVFGERDLLLRESDRITRSMLATFANGISL